MNKYRNQPITLDGVRFPSKREANRYSELKLLLQQGLITELELQPRFKLAVLGVHVCTYVGDFRYLDPRRGRVVEDAKGVRTAVYKIKKKLVKILLGIEITEV